MEKAAKVALVLLGLVTAISVCALFYKTLVLQDFVIIEPEEEGEGVIFDEAEEPTEEILNTEL